MNGTELDRELQTLEQFEKWLNDQTGTIGFARDGCNCPLHNFLTTKIEEDKGAIVVASNGIASGDGRAKHSKLSYEFMRQIDDGRHNNEAVTARQALAALKQAKRTLFVRG